MTLVLKCDRIEKHFVRLPYLDMSGDRRSRSRSLRRRSYSRSRSRNRSKSADKARQPCVFYFSKEAKGCKFSGRECKFSHDKYDYENWNKDGKLELKCH